MGGHGWPTYISCNVSPVCEPAKQVAEGQGAIGAAAQNVLLSEVASGTIRHAREAAPQIPIAHQGDPSLAPGHIVTAS